MRENCTGLAPHSGCPRRPRGFGGGPAPWCSWPDARGRHRPASARQRGRRSAGPAADGPAEGRVGAVAGFPAAGRLGVEGAGRDPGLSGSAFNSACLQVRPLGAGGRDPSVLNAGPAGGEEARGASPAQELFLPRTVSSRGLFCRRPPMLPTRRPSCARGKAGCSWTVDCVRVRGITLVHFP